MKMIIFSGQGRGSLIMIFVGKFGYIQLNILSRYDSIPVSFGDWEGWWFQHSVCQICRLAIYIHIYIYIYIYNIYIYNIYTIYIIHVYIYNIYINIYYIYIYINFLLKLVTLS